MFHRAKSYYLHEILPPLPNVKKNVEKHKSCYFHGITGVGDCTRIYNMFNDL